MTMKLFLKPPGGSFSECLADTCCNQTPVDCKNCINQTYIWLVNFSSSDVGTWFYQFQMVNNVTEEIATQTSGTDSFEVQDIPDNKIETTKKRQIPRWKTASH
jgi:hypothetical protein